MKCINHNALNFKYFIFSCSKAMVSLTINGHLQTDVKLLETEWKGNFIKANKECQAKNIFAILSKKKLNSEFQNYLSRTTDPLTF